MKRAPLLLLSLGLVLTSPLAAQMLQTRTPAGAASLQKTAVGWRVDQGHGLVTLPVPSSVHFTAFQPSGATLFVAGVNGGPLGQSLVLVRGQGKDFQALPTPLIPPEHVVLSPMPILGPAGLEALLWIEGVSLQEGAVKSALWNGSSFAPAQTLSPAGPGTQTALQAVRLQGGSWLAAWSAFDGQDDEIVWSRFDGQSWSTPQPISSNQVPDITPALKANGKGALLVWSFYDGNDYRLQAASFEDGKWQMGEVFGGKGASYPTFAETQGATLLFRQIDPESWQVVELSEDAKALRRASIPTSTRKVPAILAADQDAVTIEWSFTDRGTNPVSIAVPWEEKKP